MCPVFSANHKGTCRIHTKHRNVGEDRAKRTQRFSIFLSLAIFSLCVRMPFTPSTLSKLSDSEGAFFMRIISHNIPKVCQSVVPIPHLGTRRGKYPHRLRIPEITNHHHHLLVRNFFIRSFPLLF